MSGSRRLALVLAVVAALAVGVPGVIAADPSPSPRASPGERAAKPAKAPKVEVTLRGTIERTTDEKGRPTFTLTSGGTTYELSAGPKWFHGASGGPLAAYVGKTVTVHGWQREGTTDVSVDTVDGVALRAAGRPPWAGGPKAVGERHPGWKAWKLNGERPGRGLGREHAPGQLKDKPAADDEAATG